MSCCAGQKDLNSKEADLLFAALQKDAANKSLLKKHLSKQRLDALKNKTTKQGGTLADCIRSGCENADSCVGIYACDPDAYTAFALVMDEIIKEYHRVTSLRHPESDFGDLENLPFDDLDPDGEMIVSTRVRIGRNLDGYGFPPTISPQKRQEIEKKSMEVLNALGGDLQGAYQTLSSIDKATQEQLIKGHYLFHECDRFLRSAGACADWPSGRGVFFNKSKEFVVWVNEEDHLRFIVMQSGGNLKDVYTKLVNGIKDIEKAGLSFAKSKDLGYITFCPSNLGTALRASVHIKLPNLSKKPEFRDLCDRLNIQARGVHGEHTASENDIVDLSNKRRLGLTEIEAVEEMRKGVEAIIEQEKLLASGAAPAETADQTASANEAGAAEEAGEKEQQGGETPAAEE